MLYLSSLFGPCFAACSHWGWLKPGLFPCFFGGRTAHAALTQQQAQAAHENEGLLDRVQRLQNQLIERNELELKIASLQKAHKAQTAYKTVRIQIRRLT